MRNEDYMMNYEECDLEEIIKLDEYAFGTNRKGFVTKRIMQSEQCTVVRDKEQNGIRLRFKHTNTRK